MSVALRSWAATIASSFSGWLDREGGERRRMRGGEVLLCAVAAVEWKSESFSRMMDGAMIGLGLSFAAGGGLGWGLEVPGRGWMWRKSYCEVEGRYEGWIYGESFVNNCLSPIFRT